MGTWGITLSRSTYWTISSSLAQSRFPNMPCTSESSQHVGQCSSLHMIFVWKIYGKYSAAVKLYFSIMFHLIFVWNGNMEIWSCSLSQSHINYLILFASSRGRHFGAVRLIPNCTMHITGPLETTGLIEKAWMRWRESVNGVCVSMIFWWWKHCEATIIKL